MTREFRIVFAQAHHLDTFLAINQASAPYDLISRRSFRRFIQHEQAEIFAFEVSTSEGWLCVGYAILLYRKATQLVRLYSLAIDLSWQQQGWGSELLTAMERQARDAHGLFLRLEVPVQQQDILQFFRQRGYVRLGFKSAYFDDASDAFVLQKQLHHFNKAQAPRLVPYVEQSTDFTCGPACLLMALAYFNVPLRAPEFEELAIWREATTIFMTSGHGGCGPHGLARAALNRGLTVEVWANQAGPIMLDSVRSLKKRAVMERIQQADIQALQQENVALHLGDYDLNFLSADLLAGKLVLALISTYQFDQMKAPHWVLVTAVDEEFVYINDPDADLLPWQTLAERQYLPVPKATFVRAFGYGTQRLRTAVVVSVSAVNQL